MKGIEISRAFYEQYGREMIESEFAQYKDRIAVGLVGHGSECFGFDDEISRDHDFEPSFCIWLTEDDEREFGFKLFRAYQKLPKSFYGIEIKDTSLGGSGTKGVMTISDFYRRYTGRAGAPESNLDWLYVPSHYLAEATNGEVFCDPLGEFTRIREEIKHGMPEDVRRKRIASCAFYMAQTGQYNLSRCLSHSEIGAARLALADFVKNAIEIVFLLNRTHMPYYKWAFRAMRELKIMGNGADTLEDLINTDDLTDRAVIVGIERFCSQVIRELVTQGLSLSSSDYLESHAYSINDSIKDGKLRNMNIIL